MGFNSAPQHWASDPHQDGVLALIDQRKTATSAAGTLVQRLLRRHRDASRLRERIGPDKDVDGCRPYNVGRLAQRMPLLRPCTPKGIITLLESTGVDLHGRDAVVVVEGVPDVVNEEDVLGALQFAHSELIRVIDLQSDVQSRIGKPKIELSAARDRSALEQEIRAKVGSRLEVATQIKDKKERTDAIKEVEGGIRDGYAAAFRSEKVAFDSLEAVDARRDGERQLGADVKEILHDLRAEAVRNRVLETGERIDGRGAADIRQIACELRVVPRPHGVAMFTRGETQALVTTTLGGRFDAQTIDSLTERYTKPFYLHYNFPGYSTGEPRPNRGPGRREVGHGNLAERAIKAGVPSAEDFPYTIRIVSETLESNGSSSMAAICGGTLSLMDAGVPIKAPVAGIAMGLITDGNRVAILSDILGDEDHLGDMDFKVAGTENGITSLQMDIKVASITPEIMEKAMAQAKAGRLHLLEEMGKALTGAQEFSVHAPRIETMQVPTDKIREVIKANKSAKQANLIKLLNPILRGWANYHSHVVAKETFSRNDKRIWSMLWRWAVRRHPNKGARWVKDKYFKTRGTRNWVFATTEKRKDGTLKEHVLLYQADTPIKRHLKIKAHANPHDPQWEPYFESRWGKKMLNSSKGRSKLYRVWQRQEGMCSSCQELITRQTPWNVRHIRLKSEGGSDAVSNLQMHHLNCRSSLFYAAK